MDQTDQTATPTPEDYLESLYQWGLQRLDEVFRTGNRLGIEIYFLRTRDGEGQLTLSPVDIPSLGLPEHIDVGELLPMQFMSNFPDFDCALTLRSVLQVVRERPLNEPMPWIDASQEPDRKEFYEVKVGTRRALATALCPVRVESNGWWMERVPLKHIEHLANEAGELIPVANFIE